MKKDVIDITKDAMDTKKEDCEHYPTLGEGAVWKCNKCDDYLTDKHALLFFMDMYSKQKTEIAKLTMKVQELDGELLAKEYFDSLPLDHPLKKRRLSKLLEDEPMFTMSMYMTKEMLYKAKAEHYMKRFTELKEEVQNKLDNT